MKNSLRMIGISVISWFGLGIELANAMTAPVTEATLNPSSFSNVTQSLPTNTASLKAPYCSVASVCWVFCTPQNENRLTPGTADRELSVRVQ